MKNIFRKLQANDSLIMACLQIHRELSNLPTFRRVHSNQAHFVIIIPFVLTLASDMAVLYRNDAFSILVRSTKKRYSSFLKKVFIFQKICFKVLKMFKIFTDRQIKTCRSLKRRAILKIPSTVFQKNLCSFRWLENETSKKKRFPLLRQKLTQILP